jgi:hypothetical protein
METAASLEDSPQGPEKQSVQRPVVHVFLDEAGYTGPDLINRDQPAFVLASTVLPADDCRAMLDEHFGYGRDGEIKHARLAKTKRGRAQLLRFFEALLRAPETACFFGFHKEFILLALLIDFWLEPLAHRDGVNLYERGANIALTNVSYITLGATLGVAGRRELLRRFQVMHRDRTRFSYASFWDLFYESLRRHKLIEDALVGLVVAEHELGWDHLNDLSRDMLDLGDYGLLQTVEHWRGTRPGSDLLLVHDTSKMIERNRSKWEAVLDPTNPPAVVGQDRRTIEFPLPVRGLRIAESHEFSELQVADLVAGAACSVMRARANHSDNEYATQLVDLGLLDLIGGGVWPTSAISPEQLETEGPAHADSADFIGRLIERRKPPSDG